MANRFYTPHLLAPGEFVLDGPEAHHLATVRRFDPGDRITLFNGDGHEYPAEIVSVGKRSAVLAVQEAVPAHRELGFELVVASALPKGDRADYLIEKLTELGATRFIPLITTRSVVLPKDTTVEKFRRAVIEASKQCGRNTLMTVDPPAKWDELAQREDLPPTRWVLHQDGEPARMPPDIRQTGIIVAVGPEGGFAPEEIPAATSRNWKRVSLGNRILRMETAAVAAAAWVAITPLAGPPSEGLP